MSVYYRGDLVGSFKVGAYMVNGHTFTVSHDSANGGDQGGMQQQREEHEEL
jgi:hypothetical protein